jgi:hypothetical protein
MAPAAYGASSSRNGATIAADISTIVRRPWPRSAIQPAMPIVMLTAITRVSATGWSPRLGQISIHGRARTPIPTNIASTIST